MSIRLEGSGPRRVVLEIHYIDLEDLDLIVRWEDRAVVVRVPTRDLVLAIKQIEEERDAKGESTRRDSPEIRTYDDERRFREAILRAEEEFRELFRMSRTKSIFRERFTEALRPCLEAHSAEEVYAHIRRVKEEYLSPDRFPSRGESFDYLETKAAHEAWFREIKGLD